MTRFLATQTNTHLQSQSKVKGRVWQDNSLILRTYKLGEADRIIVFLTQQHGLVRAVAKGIRKTKSKLGASLEPFMQVTVQVRNGKNLDLIQQAQIIEPFSVQIVKDYKKYTTANIIVELCEKLTDELQNGQTQFALCLGALKSLSNGEYDADLILNTYLIKAMSFAGYKPDLESCFICSTFVNERVQNVSSQNGKKPIGFSIKDGAVICHNCLQKEQEYIIEIKNNEIQLLASLIKGNWEYAKKSEKNINKKVVDILLKFTTYQLDRQLKSAMVDR